MPSAFFSSRISREREIAKFHEIDEQWEGMPNPLRDKTEGMLINEGRSEDTCDHGLSAELERKSDG